MDLFQIAVTDSVHCPKWRQSEVGFLVSCAFLPDFCHLLYLSFVELVLVKAACFCHTNS